MLRYLYANDVKGFLKAVNSKNYVEILKGKFLGETGYFPSQSEVNSWKGSSEALADLIKGSNNIYMAAEVFLPYSSSRADYVLFGKNDKEKDTVVVLEMKGWTQVKPSFADDYVKVKMGSECEDLLHPSVQVKGYVEYFKDLIDFANQADMIGVSYLYNARIDYLYDKKFSSVLRSYPLFDVDTRDKLRELLEGINYGDGYEVFQRFITSRIAPQKGLIEELDKAVNNSKNFGIFKDKFVLLDDQIAVYNTVLNELQKLKDNERAVIIVEGGPGTGKSVIALKLMAELLKKGYTVFHATGSRAFTTTLRKIVGGNKLFKYFNSFTNEAEKDSPSFDVLIADEAHRIRKRSDTRFSRGSQYDQMEELIRVAKVSVFFLDPYQRVRPEELGNINLIESVAKKYTNKIYKFKLRTQFRSNGSEEYIDWIDNLLDIRKTGIEYYTSSFGIEFKIFDDPESLRQDIMKKNSREPNSARLVAGFCWEWNEPNPDGTLPEDIVISYDNGKVFKATWEAKDTGKKLAKGVPPAALWAYDPRGVSQVGSIYTIQGFEFDYVGVIWCNDLVYNRKKGVWEAHPENSADPAIKGKSQSQALELLKNTYRVLLTRGRKGVYVYFLDEDTRKFVESKIKNS